MTRKNNCLNFFKGIGCISVIIMHVRFPIYYLDGFFQSAARFSIPLFFMISGYYANSRKISLKIFHMTKICIGASIYWFVFRCFLYFASHERKDWINISKELFGINSLIRWVVFNVDPFIYILWFIFALLDCYIIYGLFNHIKGLKYLNRIMPICIIIHLLIGNILNPLGITQFDDYVYRNVWLLGMPLFMLGHWIRNNNKLLLTKLKHLINYKTIVLGIIVSIIEWFIIRSRCQIYIGSLMAAFFMILFSELFPEKNRFNILTNIGEKYSIYIYILHYSIYILVIKTGEIFGVNGCFCFNIFTTGIVILISYLCAVFLDYLLKKHIKKLLDSMKHSRFLFR